MALTFEQAKRLIRDVLAHDRWNSGLSDERLAEKLATRIANGGTALAADEARPAGRGESLATSH